MNSNLDHEDLDSPNPETDELTPVNDPPEKLSELIAHAAQGDRRAIGAIAVTYGPVLLRIAQRELHHREDAEDLVQDVYVRLLEGGARNFPPWRNRDLGWLRMLVTIMARKRRRERDGHE
jgi:DNA-directed RNA polymerase specialized sigma24 family protein